MGSSVRFFHIYMYNHHICFMIGMPEFSSLSHGHLTMAANILFSLSLVLLHFLLGSHGQSQENTRLAIDTSSNSPLLSPSGDFAFGFYRLPSGQFLLGIWFNKIPQRTVVWSGNRDNPAPPGSSVNLTFDGSLSITFPNGISSTIYRGGDATSASLLDNGNLVLKDSSSGVVWQSFDHPTDTILPGQKLPWDHRLYSNANGTVDYSTGRFMLEMATDGNLALTA